MPSNVHEPASIWSYVGLSPKPRRRSSTSLPKRS